MANLPITSYSVPQNFYVESLGGPAAMEAYLSRFPETVYSHAIDSHLYLLLYALVGPAGAGFLREQYLSARLQLEEANVSGSDLDSLYSSPFLFARLAEETYDIDSDAALLPLAQRQQVLASDASFRNRAQMWLSSIRAGGTPLGLRLAASSGLAKPVDVIENYKFLYDQYSDVPLGIEYQGTSLSLNEVILRPRNDVPDSTQQSFSFLGEPTSGYFTITLPLGVPVLFTTVIVNSDGTVTVNDITQFTQGAFITFEGSSPIYAEIGNTIDTNIIEVIQPTNWPGTTTWEAPTPGTYSVYVGQSMTGPLPYNANWSQVQTALQSLLSVGSPLNVAVTGGSLPDQSINVAFTGALSGITISDLIINTNADTRTGVGTVFPQIVNNADTPVIAEIYDDIVDASLDLAYQEFPPGDVQTMLYAVDVLRPQTSFVTTTIGQSVTQRQPANNTFSRTNYVEVLRYVTGDVNVPWPNADGVTNWIVAGQEVEAPVNNSQGGNYTNFHNIVATTVYTEGALDDEHYQNPTQATVTPWYAPYWNVHTGAFNQLQQQLYPFLAQYSTSPTFQFSPSFSLAPTNERPLITGVIGDPIGIVNNSYPAQYLGLPGVQQQSLSQGAFYSSIERTSGTDYIEFDLGSVQAVNYIYLEATAKPFLISIDYDAMDQAPSRSFVSADVTSLPNAPSVTALNYDPTSTNPWSTVTIYVGDAQGNMIYTRYIRLGFTRNPSGPPFVLQTVPSVQIIPYSLEVRNARIGRNVASSGLTGTSAGGLTPADQSGGLSKPVASFTTTVTTSS